MNKIKCYHFCTIDFYKLLLEKNKIIANENINYHDPKIPEDFVKEYVFREKRLNNGKGMFFCWSNPHYKGNIDFNDNGKYCLLELEIDEYLCIKTHYENWCSLAMDLYENDNNLIETDKYCKSIGMVNGLLDSYNSIFNIRELEEVQILIPYIESGWIKNMVRTNNKYI